MEKNNLGCGKKVSVANAWGKEKFCKGCEMEKKDSSKHDGRLKIGNQIIQTGKTKGIIKRVNKLNKHLIQLKKMRIEV